MVADDGVRAARALLQRRPEEERDDRRGDDRRTRTSAAPQGVVDPREAFALSVAVHLRRHARPRDRAQLARRRGAQDRGRARGAARPARCYMRAVPRARRSPRATSGTTSPRAVGRGRHGVERVPEHDPAAQPGLVVHVPGPAATATTRTAASSRSSAWSRSRSPTTTRSATDQPQFFEDYRDGRPRRGLRAGPRRTPRRSPSACTRRASTGTGSARSRR